MIGASIVLISTYMLIASGYVVIYRASRVMNFAQGSLFMLGGYFAYAVAATVLHSLPPMPTLLLALLSGCVLSFVMGIIIFYLALRYVTGQSPAVAVLLTIGLSMAIEGLIGLIWGPSFVPISNVLKVPNVLALSLAGVRLSTFDLAIVIAAVAWIAGLALFYRFTRIGMAMRAASEGVLLASFRGINVFRLVALAWGISLFGAGLAGVLYAGNTNLNPGLSFIGIKALTVAMLGGFNSLAGVVPAAIIIGLAEALMLRFGDPTLGDVVSMLILLVVLIFRPWGILGRTEEIERV
jgi:branched-chain amino acid transport system permease protein